MLQSFALKFVIAALENEKVREFLLECVAKLSHDECLEAEI